jgi:hypothetical protein
MAAKSTFGNYYKVVYNDHHGQAYWIGSAFDKYDAIRKSKAHPTQVITAELFDDYEKKNPIDKVNVKKQTTESTESTGWLFDDDGLALYLSMLDAKKNNKKMHDL